MLKPILVVCIIHLCPGFAAADETVSREWSRQAAHLSEDIRGALEGAPLEADVENEIMMFAATAERLARDMTRLEEAEDLVCIFRGMAEEADLQLRLLHMPGMRQDALRRLATLMHDAERIGLAASHIEERTDTRPDAERPPVQCEADPQTSYQYLTEQP